MARIGRPGLSDQHKLELWQRWKDGQSHSEIARALGKHPASIHGIVEGRGGLVPPLRTRSRLSLGLPEREAISRGLAIGHSIRAIAHALQRAPSTISREVTRNAGRTAYRAVDADERAWGRAVRPKQCYLATHDALRALVAIKLHADWSPAQIAGWLVREFPEDGTMRISHETIYRSLYIQARGVLRRELRLHLRTRRRMRRSNRASTAGQARGQIVDAISIADRPATVEDRAIPGSWEGDLLAGAKNTHIATLVERQSRFVQLLRITGKDMATVVQALIREVQQLPAGLMTSLTWDRGMEMAQHRVFTVATDVAVYFCDPKSPWQRGTNENTNGLLRQYFPTGTDLSTYTQADLDAIALKLNTRPRKTLGFLTPGAILAACVASTG
ncbi:MAG: IS30 family transposase [Gemmatimonadaceae bacterium]|nr:IS30 family transposase [Gemmatimonadaceae bacterium]